MIYTQENADVLKTCVLRYSIFEANIQGPRIILHRHGYFSLVCAFKYHLKNISSTASIQAYQIYTFYAHT